MSSTVHPRRPAAGRRRHRARLRRRRLLAVGVGTALVLAGCSSDESSGPSSAAPSSAETVTVAPTDASTSTTAGPVTTDATTTSIAPTTTAATGDVGGDGGVGPRLLSAFAPYADVPLLDGSTASPWPALPTSLDDVDVIDWVRERITADPDLLGAIQANGFGIQAGSGARFFHNVYEQAYYEYQTLYVTTDALYNAWHLVFAKALRDTERDVLSPILGELLTGAVDAARSQADQLAGTELADHAERAAAMYEAAATLFGLDVGAISDRAQAEVELANAAAKTTTSPITGFQECLLPDSFQGCVDYTLFLPRGHYTSSPELERWFRAMSELGQQAFYLGDADSLRVGLLAARVVSGGELASLWQQIYEPTAFLVGVADDYTPVEAAAAVAAVAPAATDDPTALADDAVVEAIGDELASTRDVAIDPENTSVRVMGARLVLDSYVIDQLVWPNVGTDDERRVNASPLDLASVFGSTLATKLQVESGQPDYLHYDEQLAAMREFVGARSGEAWAGTVYDAWLHALEPQWVDRSVAYPPYMQTEAWAAKSLQTGFGSYTELKHDTLLFAKQSSAGEGEGPEPPAWEPQHWVEPDPVTIGRLAGVAQLMRDGLAARGLLPDATAQLLDSYVELTTWLQGVATAELAGDVATGDDNTRLGQIGAELELLWYLSSDIARDPGAIPDYEDSAALIADIARSSEEILELGVGTPEEIYVIVPDGDGGYQLAVGATYSYWEFWRPVTAQRLTDQEWRGMLTAGTAPARPMWLGPVLAGAEVADTPRVQQVGS